MRSLILWVPVLWVGCSPSAPVFEDIQSVQDAQALLSNARFTATMESYTEATGDGWGRVVEADWMADHAVGDSSMAGWRLSDTYFDDEDTTTRWYGLWQAELTQIGADSILKADTVEGRSMNGNWVPSYYASLALPVMLWDSTWWAKQMEDSLMVVTTEHILPEGGREETYVLTLVEVQDSTSEDYHADTYSQSQWTFRAPDGLPVRMEEKWFRGDMAYGRDMSISWDWELTNDETVSAAIAGWETPDWAKAPEPKDPAVDGGGDEDWYEETLAALPAVGSAAPAISGKLLDGQSAALSDYLGQVVYLDFWYIGCGPCMRAMPHLDHMQKEFGPEGFTVLGVNHHQKPEMVDRYLARRGLDIPQLMIDSLPEGYPVKAYPTWMVIDREGAVVACDMGYGEGADVTLDSLVRVTL